MDVEGAALGESLRLLSMRLNIIKKEKIKSTTTHHKKAQNNIKRFETADEEIKQLNRKLHLPAGGTTDFELEMVTLREIFLSI